MNYIYHKYYKNNKSSKNKDIIHLLKKEIKVKIFLM